MYCAICGHHNPERSKFCQSCGTQLTNTHSDSERSKEQIEASDTDNIIDSQIPPFPYVISIWKLVILSVTTFGLYQIYWFYKQKKSFYSDINEKHGKTYIFFDAIFAGFTSYILFKQVSKAERKIDKTRPGLAAGALAIVYFILVALWRLPNGYFWLELLSILPLIPAQKSINFYWEEKFHNRLIKSKFGPANYIWATVGSVFTILALTGTFFPNNTTPDKTPPQSTNNSPVSLTQSSQNNNSDVTQSVIDLSCDNNEGGSGTIITEGGIVLTNNHVISGASSCLITLPDSSTGAPKAIYKATPITVPNLSKQYDLAFLQINGAYTDNNGKIWGVYPTTFQAYKSPKSCDGYTPKLGEDLRIYGYPVTSGGYNLTVTDGIISSFSDNNDILTSAKIDSGNSGGLAVNNNNCFIGVPSAVVSGNYQNLGVIIPSSVVYDFGNKIESPYQSSSTQSAANHAFDTSCLTLKNGQMYGNSYYNPNPTYIASLYNGCSQAVKNVVIRVNFYAANATAGTTPSDTEYINLGINYLGPGDAHAIDGTINTPFDTSGNFNWEAEVYSADPD